jgi:hypothetical protein
VLCNMAASEVVLAIDSANTAVNVECIISEVMFVLSNNFGKVPKANIISLAANFYTVDELVDTKAMIFSLTSAAHLSDVHLVQRKAGPNKRRLDMEDIYNAFVSLDTNKTKTPRFVAADMKRLPSISPSDADVCALAVNVDQLKSEVAALSSLRSEVKAVKDAVNGTFNSLSVQLKELCIKSSAPVGTADLDTVMNDHQALRASVGTSGHFRSAIAGKRDEKSTLWSEVVARGAISRPTTIGFPEAVHKQRWSVVGANSSSSSTSCAVKAVPRPIVAFVGRLHEDTTELELVDMLSKVGMEDVRCRRLKVPDGRKFKTAAFRVSCDVKSADLFYDECSWPEGCEVRDWVFKN